MWTGFRGERAYFSQVLTPTLYQKLETRNFQWEVGHKLAVVGLPFFLSPFCPPRSNNISLTLFLFCQSQVGPRWLYGFPLNCPSSPGARAEYYWLLFTPSRKPGKYLLTEAWIVLCLEPLLLVRRTFLGWSGWN